MKKTILLAVIAIVFGSCTVQQFPVNSTVLPFANGGTVFGERTRGTEVKKGREFFLFGINISNCDTKEMAGQIKAEHYTIETKHNLLSEILYLATFTLFEYKIVKVIKRDK